MLLHISTIKPLNNTIKSTFVFDLNPPNLILTSRNNTWVADKDGQLIVDIELINNLDTEPGIKLILKDYNNDIIWKSWDGAIEEEKYRKLASNTTTLSLTVGGIFKNTADVNKRGYTLRVEGSDKNGNKVVKNQVIYGKFLEP